MEYVENSLVTPSVRRHSLSTDLSVIMTALDGGALTLPPRGGGLGRGGIGLAQNLKNLLYFTGVFLSG